MKEYSSKWQGRNRSRAISHLWWQAPVALCLCRSWRRERRMHCYLRLEYKFHQLSFSGNTFPDTPRYRYKALLHPTKGTITISPHWLLVESIGYTTESSIKEVCLPWIPWWYCHFKNHLFLQKITLFTSVSAWINKHGNSVSSPPSISEVLLFLPSVWSSMWLFYGKECWGSMILS